MLHPFFKDFTITRADAGLIGIIALYVLIGYGIAAAHDALGFYNPIMYVSTGLAFTRLFFSGYVIFWGVWALYVMAFVRPPHLKDYLWQDLKKHALNKERYVKALPVFIAFIFLLSTFTSLKTMIPYVNGFAWDVRLAEIDNALHGGVDPWRLLHPLLGYPYVTMGINYVYNFWLAVLYLVLYWQLFSLKDYRTRMQFFYTMALCWAICGSFLAIVFSSGGPCYFYEITGSDRFLPLMNYLYSIGGANYKIWALVNQENLWRDYVEKAHGIGAGISAMPSVHVGTALIFMLVGLRSGTFWKIASIGFFAVILLGSIHLGWHYAIDGYVAILTTLPLWYISGSILRKLHN